MFSTAGLSRTGGSHECKMVDLCYKLTFGENFKNFWVRWCICSYSPAWIQNAFLGSRLISQLFRPLIVVLAYNYFLHYERLGNSLSLWRSYFSRIEEDHAAIQNCSDLVGLWIGNGVSDTDAVTFDQQPVVDNRLDVAVKPAILLVAIFKLGHVKQGAWNRFTLIGHSHKCIGCNSLISCIF